MDHRVAPHALVDLLALQDLTLGLGQQLDELVLASGQLDRDAGHERLELVGADFDLTDHDRGRLDPHVGALAPADDRFDAGDQLFRVAGLGDPVVRAQPQAADALGDRGLAGADDHAQPGQARAELVEIRPPLRSEHREVHDHGVEPQRNHGVQRHRRGQHTVLPANSLQALTQHLKESGVGIDHRQPDRRLACGAAAPLLPRHQGLTCRRHLTRHSTHRWVWRRGRNPPDNCLFTS